MNAPATRDPKTAQKILGDFAPKFAQLSDDVLFGDVWERPELNKRDRSLITCTALVATGRTEQMAYHFPLALANGVTRAEMIEMITQMAFYTGWPNSWSAMSRLRELLDEEKK